MLSRIIGTRRTIIPHQSRLRLPLLPLLFLAACTLIGCKSTPRAELSAYTEAFNRVRDVGEDVVLGYHTIQRKHAELAAAVAAAEVRSGERDPREDGPLGIAFDPSGVADPGETADAVAVRLAAWEVASKYNDALAALADNRSAGELSDAVSGLLGSLQSVPISAVVSAAGEAVPYVKALEPVIAIIEKELAKKRFRQAVLAAREPNAKFFDLLIADAKDLWDAESALLENEYDQHVTDGINRVRRIFVLADGLEVTDDGPMLDIIGDINAARAQLFDTKDEDLLAVEPAEGNAISAETLVVLKSLRDEAVAHFDEARSTRVELIALRDAIESYVTLIRQTRVRLDRLETAVETGRVDPDLSVSNLTTIITAARGAYAVYKESR